jgi:MerR family transcriptional regulator, redox-sensitive transcriptional activator SoxR
MSMSEATLSIGQVADEAGINVSAIRFYEREGLLPETERVGGQRRFTTEAITRLGVIATAKRAGLSLAEVSLLLGANDDGVPTHEPLRDLAERKLPEVEALIARAEAVRDWLVAASDCDCETLDVCALFSDGAGSTAD